MPDQRFTRDDRVRRQADFDRVYAADAYAADEFLVVQGCTNGLPVSRLGLSISRKTGNAVARNRWKRLIREAFRTQRQAIPTGLDLVVRPRRGAVPQLAGIKRSLPRLAARVARRLEKRPS